MQLKKKVEGEYQPDLWPKGPERRLCPLVRPEIAMGSESQIEAWSPRVTRRRTTSGSHQEHASRTNKRTTVSHAGNRQRFKPVPGHQTCLSAKGTRMSAPKTPSKERCALDIPLHRRIWVGALGTALPMTTPQILPRTLMHPPQDDKLRRHPFNLSS